MDRSAYARPFLMILAAAALAMAGPASADDGQGEASPPDPGTLHAGERIGPEHFGPVLIEDMAAVIERDAAMEKDTGNPKMPADRHGVWMTPSRRSSYHPHSGQHYIINKYGDTRMGIGFPERVTVHGAYVAGQADRGVWSTGIRVIGYRAGAEVARSDWFRDIDATPDWFAIDLEDVDRIVFESEAVVMGGGWYGLDDFAYTPAEGKAGQPPRRVVLDFENLGYRATLTGSDYAGLTWETGTGVFEDESIHAPQVPPGEEIELEEGGDAVGLPAAMGTSELTLINEFQGVIRGDAGSFSFPPDTNGAIGLDHYMIVVNRNVAVYDRDSGAELSNVHISAFLPGSSGDPRVLWDHFEDRWVVLVTDFSNTESLFLAVSMTEDPLGDWFKTSFELDQGSDAGCWPDYPTLGFDQHGYYSSAFMVGCGMSVFAIEKAPMLKAEPSLGAVTAFRGLAFEGAIQPCVTHGQSGGQIFISRINNDTFRVRRIFGSIQSPALAQIGLVTVSEHEAPPNVPALGSSSPLDHTVGNRLLNAVYRNGSIWTAHDVGFFGTSVARWYEIDADSMEVVQEATVFAPNAHAFYGAIAVNSRGDVAMGFSVANSSEYASCHAAVHAFDDDPGAMSPNLLLQEGLAAQNNIDGFGRNRWGDYSLTTVDPRDDRTFWTIQEYAHANNIWGTWVAHLGVNIQPLAFSYPEGRPESLTPSGGDTLVVDISGVGDADLDPVSPVLHVDLGDGFIDIAMTPVGLGSYQAEFPSQACGQQVTYYVSAESLDAEVATDPEEAPEILYSAVATEAFEIALDDDLEAESGWSAGVPDDEATAGIWERVDPIGTPVHPEDDHTPGAGTMCFLTGQAEPGEDAGDSDVDGGKTTLVSPLFAVDAVDAKISYWRWFSNNVGINPHHDTLTVDISNDDGKTWSNVEIVGPDGPETRGGWFQHTFFVKDVTEPSDQMRLRFVADDQSPISIVEAAIDDVLVRPLVCPALIGDVDGGGEVDVDDLVDVILAWGDCPTEGECPADVDGDGDVDVDDLTAVILNWTS